jgi:hypothetical protein
MVGVGGATNGGEPAHHVTVAAWGDGMAVLLAAAAANASRSTWPTLYPCKKLEKALCP